MPVIVGTHLGPYEILARLGVGGMGEVYRAKDTRLKREVALKVLPEAFASVPERMLRFQREAEALAALNHPNIAAIYGLEDGALIMELVQGETLSGPLPFDTALNYAQQIAHALEYAHERGVIHRDIKPANIKVTPDGTLKLLDFGLAKAIADPFGPSADATNSPTSSVGVTEAGAIMGTVAYMAPEQAQGKPVDKRADIWAFGVLLYEMLTGRRPFHGETMPDTLAAVLNKDPDWDPVPAKARPLLQRCLMKDPQRRLRDIGDAMTLLEVSPAVEPEVGPAKRSGRAADLNKRSRGILFAVGISILVLGIVAASYYRESRRNPKPASAPGTAVVVLMDTSAPMGVYDPETRKNSGTNADDLSEILRDLPVAIHKETVGSTWDREDQVMKQNPDLIMIHHSCFFHAINFEFKFGYPPFGESDEVLLPTGERIPREYLFFRLIALAESKLLAFLGYVGVANPKTKILVYSRGTGNGWSEADRREFVENLERRFPSLKSRVFAMVVAGQSPTFRDPATAALVKRQVRSLLAF